jgi:hypothetical protein
VSGALPAFCRTSPEPANPLTDPPTVYWPGPPDPPPPPPPHAARSPSVKRIVSALGAEPRSINITYFFPAEGENLAMSPCCDLGVFFIVPQWARASKKATCPSPCRRPFTWISGRRCPPSNLCTFPAAKHSVRGNLHAFTADRPETTASSRRLPCGTLYRRSSPARVPLLHDQDPRANFRQPHVRCALSDSPESRSRTELRT